MKILKFIFRLFSENKLIINILKWSVLVFTYLYISYKLYYFFDFSNDELQFDKNLFKFLIIAILAFFNWSTEAIKWKYILNRIEVISFKKALKGTLSGFPYALLTPNRIGEPFGRLSVVKKQNRKSAIIATYLASFSQLTTTFVMGFCGMLGLFFMQNSIIENITINRILLFIIFILPVLMITIYFNLPYFIKKIANFFFNTLELLKIIPFANFGIFELFVAFLLSTLRYFIFANQFLLLLIIFSCKLTIYEAYISISLTYFITSLIPSFYLSEIGIRGAVSISVIGIFSENTLGILLATGSLWIINQAFPSLIGVVLNMKSSNN